MDAPRALVFRPLVKGNEALGTRYKRDAPFRAVVKVKTLAVLFLAYPREMKHIPRNLNHAAILSLLVSMEMVQSIPTRARAA